MRNWYRGIKNSSTNIDELDPKCALLNTGMKYAHLIEEPVSTPVKTYLEYQSTRKKKAAPARKALLERLKAERRERIKKCGKIKVPKIDFNMVY